MSRKSSHRAPAASSEAAETPARSRAALCASVLRTVSEAIERQQGALLAGDPAAVGRSIETLSRLLSDLSLVKEAVETRPASSGTGKHSPALGGEEAAPIGALARLVREQLRTNQVLAGNGLAIADHYALCVAEASPVISPALISEIA